MAERTAVVQKVQIGVESTPGTAVPANRQLFATGFETDPQVTDQAYRPQGSKYETIIVDQKEWSQVALSGYPAYGDMIYLLESLMSTDTSHNQLTDGGTSTGAYKWIFDSLNSVEDTPKTLTLEQGSPFRAHKMANGVVTDLGIKFNRDTVDLSGNMIATRLTDAITLTASPTAVELVPCLAASFDVFVDPTFGALGTTKLGRLWDGHFQVGNRFGPFWPIDSSLTSFGGVVELVPTLGFTAMVEANAAGMSYLDTLRAGTTVFCRIRSLSPTNAYAATTFTATTNSTTALTSVSPVLTAADVGKAVTGPGTQAGTTLSAQAGATGTLSLATTTTQVGGTFTLGTSIPYSLTIDMAMKVRTIGKFSDTQGIYAIEFPFGGVFDSGWGKAFHIEVVNKTSTL